MDKRIRCQICSNEINSHCTVKNEKVKASKSRRCEFFELSVGKIPVKKKIKSTYVPFHLRDKNAYKRHVQEKEAAVTAQPKLDALKSPDCLSRFRSTAGKESE